MILKASDMEIKVRPVLITHLCVFFNSFYDLINIFYCCELIFQHF